MTTSTKQERELLHYEIINSILFDTTSFACTMAIGKYNIKTSSPVNIRAITFNNRERKIVLLSSCFPIHYYYYR